MSFTVESLRLHCDDDVGSWDVANVANGGGKRELIVSFLSLRGARVCVRLSTQLNSTKMSNDKVKRFGFKESFLLYFSLGFLLVFLCVRALARVCDSSIDRARFVWICVYA